MSKTADFYWVFYPWILTKKLSKRKTCGGKKCRCNRDNLDSLDRKLFVCIKTMSGDISVPLVNKSQEKSDYSTAKTS